MNIFTGGSTTCKRKPIIIYGTSLSAERALFWRRVSGQWVGLLRDWVEEHWPGRYAILNASRWGATSQWAGAHLQQRVLRHRPACVLLEFAINDADVGRSISLSQAGAHLQRMVEAIQVRSPACRIAVVLTNPCFGRYAALRPDLAEYYAVYRDYAHGAGLDVIDLYSAWEQWLAAHRDSLQDFLPDGLHPSPLASSELIFPEVRQQLRRVLATGAGG